MRRRQWEKTGSKDIVERAQERVQRILADHKPEPLDRGVEKILEQIVREVDSRQTNEKHI